MRPERLNDSEDHFTRFSIYFCSQYCDLSEKIIKLITKSSSATGYTSRRYGNTSTCPYGTFRHITKSSSDVGCTRRQPGNTSTCPYAADDDFVIIKLLRERSGNYWY